MNRYANEIVLRFISQPNRTYLYRRLSGHFNDSKVHRFLEDHLNGNVDVFAGVIERELGMSDPMAGTTVFDQVVCFNNQFIGTQIAFINTHVLRSDERAPMYVLKDGLPTSRHGLQHHTSSPNFILQSWRSNPGRAVQAREDLAGDINMDPSHPGVPYNPYYGQRDNLLSTGLVVCDQSRLGTQNHVEQYENTFYKQMLNAGSAAHESTAFGVSTPGADARLLDRRSFRTNEAGVENGIPRYEARLQRRNIDRDISEGLHNAERDCMVHGYDMSTARARVDHKNVAAARYNTNCTQASHLKLYNNNSRVPEDMRYC